MSAAAPPADDPSLMEEIAIDDSDDNRRTLGATDDAAGRADCGQEKGRKCSEHSDGGAWEVDDSWDDNELSVQSSNAAAWKPLSADMASPRHGQPERSEEEGEEEELSRLRDLEENQEQLNLSLLALTTHFAQVQFRLQQISKAPPDEKERLLKSLEEFAFKGCPDLASARRPRAPSEVSETEAECRAAMCEQRAKQLQLIGQLRDQLLDLETFAYEAGTGSLPSAEVMERQRMFIDQLRAKLDLDLEGIDRLAPDELQWKIDTAVKRLINPLRAKDQLVQQLQTQITDLERFVEFLQIETGASKGMPCTCDKDRSKCAAHTLSAGAQSALSDIANRRSFGYTKNAAEARDFRKGGAGALSALALVQMYLLSNLGCRSGKFRKNELKKSAKGNHWGDLRAALELAADHLVQVSVKHEGEMAAVAARATANGSSSAAGGGARNGASSQLSAYDSDEDDVEDVFDKCDEEVVTAVRKYFCPALRDLLQHGMLPLSANANYAGGAQAAAMTPLACLPNRRRHRAAGADKKSDRTADASAGHAHAWCLFTQYYDMKHGREMSEAPARKLTQSFALESVGGAGKAVTSRQLLLSAVEGIQSSHERLKRSQDAMFKAFVCAALNQKKLVPWLRMVLRTHDITEENFYPWSYVCKTGAEDTLTLLEKLNRFHYTLPVDLAVRPFQHIKDAF